MSHPTRPEQALKRLWAQYPQAGAMVADMRRSRGRDLPDWPAWCFLPMGGWYAIVSSQHKLSRLPPHLLPHMSDLAAIGAWRYSKGTYKFAPEVLAAVAETPLTGNLPSSLFFHLPEWSIYIETPDWRWGGMPLFGFWAHLERDANTGRAELRLLLDREGRRAAAAIHLGNWTLTEALDRMMQTAAANAAQGQLQMPAIGNAPQRMAASLSPLVSLLLYICSDKPEIDDLREPGSSPSYPRPIRTRHGLEVPAAKRVREWHVGTELAKTLRRSGHYTGEGGRKRTHLRRAHWHGYWYGPRSGEREFILKWVFQTVVGGREGEERK